jgi:hypothetical protein
LKEQDAKKEAQKIMLNIFSGANNHVARRIKETPVSEAPFQHCIVDDVLPKEVFKSIHDHWPDDSVLLSLIDTGRTTKYKERFVMLLEDEFFNNLTSTDQKFWVDVGLTVMGSQVVTACYEKFKSLLDKRLQRQNMSFSLNPEMMVVSDRNNYQIGPHTDTEWRFISLLYYLSPDPKYYSYGTCLYEPKDPVIAVDHMRHYEFHDFNLHSRVEYKPNRLVVFPRTNSSFHGVEPVAVDNCDRRLIIVNIRAPEEVILSADED